mmetsp:Transcript_87319/g.151959  ORF Transcript_87319/g.151959 Transcript_87319/m.151959 type:complete len:233 (+) Transcript_87319:642-1340(+)
MRRLPATARSCTARRLRLLGPGVAVGGAPAEPSPSSLTCPSRTCPAPCRVASGGCLCGPASSCTTTGAGAATACGSGARPWRSQRSSASSWPSASGERCAATRGSCGRCSGRRWSSWGTRTTSCPTSKPPPHSQRCRRRHTAAFAGSTTSSTRHMGACGRPGRRTGQGGIRQCRCSHSLGYRAANRQCRMCPLAAARSWQKLRQQPRMLTALAAQTVDRPLAMLTPGTSCSS